MSRDCSTNKIMFFIALLGISMLIIDRITRFYLWAPVLVEIITILFCLFIIVAGFLRWKPVFIFLTFISPWLLYQGISSVFFDGSQVLFHSPIFLKKYFYTMYAIGITSGILCVFLAASTFIGLIFWRKEYSQKTR